jgi:hypothetical protein
LNEKFHALRELAEPIHKRLMAKTMAHLAVRRIDLLALGLDVPVAGGSEDDPGEPGASPLSAAFDEVQRRQRTIEATMRRDPEVDFHFEVSVLPIQEKVLAIPYFEQTDFRDLWFAQDWVEDYHYQDCCDKSAEVSEEAWAQRRADWEEALGHKTPAQMGFSFLLCPIQSRYWPRVEAILPEVAPLERRAFQHAQDTLFAERLRAQQDAGERQSPSGVLRWLASEEGKARMAALAAAYQPKLSAAITAALLFARKSR